MKIFEQTKCGYRQHVKYPYFETTFNYAETFKKIYNLNETFKRLSGIPIGILKVTSILVINNIHTLNSLNESNKVKCIDIFSLFPLPCLRQSFFLEEKYKFLFSSLEYKNLFFLLRKLAIFKIFAIENIQTMFQK